MSLKSKLAVRLPVGISIFGAVLFIPAGSFRFWQAWVYIGMLFVPALFAFTYFYKHDPQVLERRSLLKEKVPEQKRIMGLIYVVWLAASLLPGFDHRYGWSRVPLWLTVLSQIFVAGGLLMTYWVVKINRFAARTIQVESGQSVISDGPYRTIRHPMYAGMCVMWLCTPLALGSYFALPAFALLIPLVVLRLLNEEKVLRQELAGYNEYCSRTHFRLVPFVW
jgi:protein-S-isoprenylcysteine O-methyltransferase Ste14